MKHDPPSGHWITSSCAHLHPPLVIVRPPTFTQKVVDQLARLVDPRGFGRQEHR